MDDSFATVSRTGLRDPTASRKLQCSGTSPKVRPATRTRVVTTVRLRARPDEGSQPGIGKTKGRLRNGGPDRELVLLFTCFLAAALARQRLFDTLFFARLEVEGMTLHFLDDVLLLDFSLETPQGVL
jgi:hypothetical protein